MFWRFVNGPKRFKICPALHFKWFQVNLKILPLMEHFLSYDRNHIHSHIIIFAFNKVPKKMYIFILNYGMCCKISATWWFCSISMTMWSIIEVINNIFDHFETLFWYQVNIIFISDAAKISSKLKKP